jgi:hypothetical protein
VVEEVFHGTARKVIDHDHFVVSPQEPVDQMTPDETGSPSYYGPVFFQIHKTSLPIKRFYAFANIFLVRFLEFRIHRQGDYLVGSLLRMREITRDISETRVSSLQMHGNGVVNIRLNRSGMKIPQ